MIFMLLAALLIVSTTLSIRNAPMALTLSVFLIPWAGLDVNAGLHITAYLIVIAPLFFVCAVRKMLAGASIGADMSGFRLVLIHAAVWTLALIPFLPDTLVEGGGFRQPGVRSLGQIVLFLIATSTIWIVPMLSRSISDVIRLGRTYLISVLILATLGWLQLVIWNASGVDPFPIGLFNSLLGGEGYVISGVFEHDNIYIYRMSSLGGEPKGLGSAIAVALLLVQSGTNVAGRRSFMIWSVLFVSMLATFSTLAMVGWFGASVIQLFISSKYTLIVPNPLHMLSKLVQWLRRLAPILIVVFLLGYGQQIFDLVESRTTGRIEERDGGVLEDFNAAILGFLKEKPLWAVSGTGLGNAHLYADRYLPDYSLKYAEGTPFVAKSGLLRWVSELGIVSLFVFLLWTQRKIRVGVRLGILTAQFRGVAGLIARLSIPVAGLWGVSSYVSSQFYLVIGCAIALGALQRFEQCGQVGAAHSGSWIGNPSVGRR